MTGYTRVHTLTMGQQKSSKGRSHTTACQAVTAAHQQKALPCGNQTLARSAASVRKCERELSFGVNPLEAPEKATPSQEVVYVAVNSATALRPNPLSLPERQVEVSTADAHALRPPADEVHLDAGLPPVPQRLVSKAVDVEIPVELTIDPDEKVPVEGSRDLERIVVGQQQVALGLPEVGAEQQPVARPERRTDATEESGRTVRVEVTDVRTQKHGERATRRSARPADLVEAFFVGGQVRENSHVRNTAERPRRVHERSR